MVSSPLNKLFPCSVILITSLLTEDSGEEGDQCRICQIAGGSSTNPLLEPCGCVGSLQFVHENCLKRWLEAKIESGADLEAVKTCELCKQSLTLDLDDFNVNEYYRNHRYSREYSLASRNRILTPRETDRTSHDLEFH
ncbi:probable E3 ubiquitin-protein ligase MARCHF10 isoform X4 [Dromaius novaehollandiae]|uniref:probable E3 ubiquitin-protein ligase MARCHF10 isoform X4 n=1 Tax=Dromaius novaehollandiae TaxID=8790 RepID=UPI00311F6A40